MSEAPSSSKKKQIFCKFFMRGLCNKEDKCEYLHQDGGETWGFQPYAFPTKKIDENCPYYQYGFCRDGSLCSYNHIVLPEADVPEEIPIWFIEYLYDKPIEMIYEDFEKMNKDEIHQIKRKLRKNNKFKNNNKEFGNDQQRNNNIPNYNIIKNNILKVVEKKVRYFFIRSSSVDKIKVIIIFNISLAIN